jgi:uncharacterized membrane protein
VTSGRWSAAAFIVSALACAFVSAKAPWPAFQIAAALPLVLILPGSALVLAVDPGHTRTAGTERLFWCLLASLGATIAGGLILNMTAELTQVTWLAYLSGVVVVAALVSVVRQPERGVDVRNSWKQMKGARVAMPAALLGVGAIALIAGALALSVYSSSTENREHFVQLWLVPTPATAGATAERAELGVTNYEGRQVRVDISIRTPDTLVLSRKGVVLNQGQTWTYRIFRPGLVPVTATVALASDPSRILSSVKLASPV